MFTIKNDKLKKHTKKNKPSTQASRVPKNNLLSVDYTSGAGITRKLS